MAVPTIAPKAGVPKGAIWEVAPLAGLATLKSHHAFASVPVPVL
jgi:hypothetical protein